MEMLHKENRRERGRTSMSQPAKWPWRRNPCASQLGTYQPESCARARVIGDRTRRSTAALAPIMISLWKVVDSQWEPLVAPPPSCSSRAPSAVGQSKWSRVACRTAGVDTTPDIVALHTTPTVYYSCREPAQHLPHNTSRITCMVWR